MTTLKSLLAGCLLCWATATFASQPTALASDSTGLPGDHFNLEGALELFKSANSPEEFEKKLNTEDNYVNNLDLNGDGEVDYLKVNEYEEGNTRVIAIQAPVSETESQDVAVIEVEKSGDQSAVIQIVGDEDLYGKQRIVEPAEANATTTHVTPARSASPKVVVNVWAWPSVRHMYAPGYVVYRPAWRWRHYPVYWKPWRPHPFKRHFYYARPYRANYQVVRVHRVVGAPRIYHPYRTTSVVVKNRYPVTRVHRNTTHVHVNRTNHHPVKTKVVRTRDKRNGGNRGNRGGR